MGGSSLPHPGSQGEGCGMKCQLLNCSNIPNIAILPGIKRDGSGGRGGTGPCSMQLFEDD